MMEHNATVPRRLGSDGTRTDGMECQKTRETLPGTLSGTGNEDGTGCQKTRETVPGTPPETRRIEKMMTEQNARIFRIKKSS